MPTSSSCEIDVSLSGSWATLECDITEPASPDVTARLNEVVRCWANWVNALEAGNDTNLGGNAVQMSEPVIGTDFVQWHLQLYLVEPQRLNVLVNAIVRLCHNGVEVRSVYIG
ncbi:MAG: hypothetical protein LBE78_03265 [Burkholderiaceae bacterium]|nr:hypothetical protein [Burkholderiaceae bacterium]